MYKSLVFGDEFLASVYESHKTATSNMVHHVCAKSKGQSSQTNTLSSYVRRDSKKIPLEVKSSLVDACVDLCCLDIRPFDVVSGKGFLQVAQTLINIGAKYGAVDADAIIPHRQTVCDRTKAIQKVLEYSGIAVTTDMWTDEFNKRAYTVLTFHYIDEK